ncbi:nuclear transport factor 2 family protein [Nocardia sp. CA-129566]|uniref:nuclear transport factor 2 family protein n=1 Tax=Nocardia sp. CA-129566 TaxID=3239976 RepID=UPI003D951DF9
MTTAGSPAQQAVQTYHRARFQGDIHTAAQQLADEFRFRSPFIESDSPTGHLAGIEQLAQIIDRIDMISELYSDTDAVLIYDLHTKSPVGVQHTAEHFRLHDGRITAINLIFDAAPWKAIMATTDLETR